MGDGGGAACAQASIGSSSLGRELEVLGRCSGIRVVGILSKLLARPCICGRRAGVVDATEGYAKAAAHQQRNEGRVRNYKVGDPFVWQLEAAKEALDGGLAVAIGGVQQLFERGEGHEARNLCPAAAARAGDMRAANIGAGRFLLEEDIHERGILAKPACNITSDKRASE